MKLCSNSSIKNIKKLNIELHEKIVDIRDLDYILSEMNYFENKVSNICVPVGFNAIKHLFDLSYISLVGFSSIQDYICKREGLEIVYKTLENMQYREIENPFVIEIKCSDGKKEILNSCLEEKIFKKKINNSEIYISIFPENAVYYRIKGKELIEDKIVYPEDPITFTILSKIYRFNRRDLLDFLVLTLTSSKILEKIDENKIRGYIFIYSKASGIDKIVLLNKMFENLLEIRKILEKINNYINDIYNPTSSSSETSNIDILDKKIELYVLSKVNKINIVDGLKEVNRLIEIIKNLKEDKN